MKKYKIIGAIVLFFIVLSIVTLSLGPTWNVGPGEKPQNVAADILLWFETGCLAVAIVAFLVYRIYAFIKYTVLHKKREEDINEYVIKNRENDHRDRIQY